MRISRTLIATPLGEMVALASDTGLCALEFIGPRRLERLESRFQRWFPPHEIADGRHPVLQETRDWLTAYFDGASADLDRPSLDLRGAPFERRVWAALCEIRPGATSTYGAIARQLGSPGAARAVGAANGANPVGIVVPCHRVIGSSGTLTGYGGGLNRKSWLLAHEARWRRDAPTLF
jgi:methylated-DNA-[protein]-cysteine S-methyltransferase